MSSELIGVIVGGVIGVTGGLVTMIVHGVIEGHRRRKAIQEFMQAEVTGMLEKAKRFLASESSCKQLAASSPVLVSMATELKYLKGAELVAVRKAIILDMELRAEATETKAKACIDACESALRQLSNS